MTTKKMLSNRIASQSTTKLERLKVLLQDCDTVVFDNNYDLGRHLYDVTFNGKMYRFSNLNVPAGEHVRVLPALKAHEIKKYELALFHKIVAINPSIKIFFLNYPVTAFENRAKPADIIRANNARSVNEFMREGIENGTVPKNVTFIGCTDLHEHLFSKYYTRALGHPFQNFI
ncbi:hypothetical protein [Halomonas sp. KRD171]|uniref:hypothetical protein n=1 Tax=Halomonas sp. KRD171 TaxID=2729726 RepID=UPI0019D3131B|nr:hypothetical protein [Halomonas sp. KRD171]